MSGVGGAGVELRINPETGAISCVFGIITNSNPDRDGVKPDKLMLITRRYVDEIIATGTVKRDSTLVSVSQKGDRVFVHMNNQLGNWIWELFDAYWDDGVESDIMIGKWPEDMSIQPTQREQGYMEGWESAQVPEFIGFESCVSGTVLYNRVEDLFVRLDIEYDETGEELRRSWIPFVRNSAIAYTQSSLGAPSDYRRVIF